MSRTWRRVVVTGVAVAALVLTPAMAMACRITNATPWNVSNVSTGGDTVYVWFSCGSGCGVYYEIEPGTYVNTSHGQGGTVQACTYNGLVYDNPRNPAVGVDTYYRETGTLTKVAGSGEARLKNPGNDLQQFRWAIYDSDNNLTRTVDHGSRDFRRAPDSTYCWEGTP